ncbi:hypothetical protein C8Q79DRAFT_332110 [Trametes meyenii]|nr:hypothetical protein C8Q79DRAFT_332110 [Trametes meyenii]
MFSTEADTWSSFDDWRSLAQDIEDLEYAPISPALLEDDSSSWPAPTRTRKQKRNSNTSERLTRTLRSMPLPPQITSHNAHAQSTEAPSSQTTLGLSDRNKVAKAREREEFRARLASQAPPSPEAALKKDPFLLRTIVKDAPKSKSAAVADAPCQSREGVARDSKRKIEKDPKQYSKSAPAKISVDVEPPRADVGARFKVEIIPDYKHSTIWDGSPEDIFAWSGVLIIHDNKPSGYLYAEDIVQDFAIQFQALCEPRSDPDLRSSPSPYSQYIPWQATYSGYRIPPGKDLSDIPQLRVDRGIALETYFKVVETQPGALFASHVRFWVPIPLSLFAGAEHRTFACRATIKVQDWDLPDSDVVAEGVAVGIERLHTERFLPGVPAATCK